MSLTSTAVSAPAPPALALHVGVTLAFDGFGTGYSSLRSLDTLPIDTIKVDQPGSDSCQGVYFGKPPPSAAATPQTGR
jgi:hypothetical protein